LNQEQEDSISNEILKNGRARLALQRAIIDRNSKYSKILKFLALFYFFISLISVIIIVIYNNTFFQDISNIINQQLFSIRWRYSHDLAILSLLFENSILTSVFNRTNEIYLDLISNEDPNQIMIDLSSDLSHLALRFAQEGRNYFQILLDEFATGAENGIKIYSSGYIYLKATSHQIICKGNHSTNIRTLNQSVSVTMASLATLTNYQIMRLAGLTADVYFHTPLFCGLISSIPEIAEQQTIYQEILREFSQEWCFEKQKISLILLLALPISIFIIGFVPYFLCYILYIKDLECFLRLMTSVEEKYRIQASEPIAQNNSINVSDSLSKLNGKHFHIFICIIILFIINTLSCPILLFAIINKAYSITSIFTSLSCWIIYVASRNPLLVELLIHIFLGFFLKDEDVVFSSSQKQFDLATNSSDNLFKILDFLNKGDNDILPLRGYDGEYDHFVLQELCDVNYSEGN
jgi:hypothetical protein